MLHAHRRAIIEPVKVGQSLGVGAIFDQFLGTAMEQPNMRIDPLDNLPVQFHDQPKHTMGRGMLRAEIDGEILDRLVTARDVSSLGRTDHDIELGGHSSSPSFGAGVPVALPPA